MLCDLLGIFFVACDLWQNKSPLHVLMKLAFLTTYYNKQQVVYINSNNFDSNVKKRNDSLIDFNSSNTENV